MDREGAYGDSLEPSNYLKALDNVKIWADKMWILHLGIPYKGDIHNTMPTRSEWNARQFIPLFKGEGTDAKWLTRRLNIINVDFIQRFGWVDAIVNLNTHFPKTWPTALVPQVVEQDLTWQLSAINESGKLRVRAQTTSPFRAQQGKILVYAAGHAHPVAGAEVAQRVGRGHLPEAANRARHGHGFGDLSMAIEVWLRW